MYFKDKFERPRPSFVLPSLMPPIAIPGHASFPSGHSTQAHLVVACLKPALQASISAAAFAAISSGLDVLADRIARNREIAGLHYPSDLAAGAALAREMFTLLQPLATFQAALTAAKAEWTSVT